VSQLNGLDKFDEIIDKSGAGGILDRAAHFFFGERIPSDGLRNTGSAASIAGFLPYRGYLPSNQIFENLFSLGWVVEVAPLVGSSAQVESILQGLFEEGFPEEVHVAVSTYASPYVGDRLERWARPRVDQGGVLEHMARYRAEHFRRMIWTSGSKAGPFHVRDYRVFMSVSVPKKSGQQGKAIAKLDELRQRVEATLRTLGLDSRRQTASDVINLVHGWLNMGRESCNPRLEYDEDRFVCDQIVRGDSSIDVFKDRLVMHSSNMGVESYMSGPLSARRIFESERAIRTFTAARMPKVSSQGHMAGLLGHFTQDMLRLSGAWWSTVKLTYQSAEKSKMEAQLRSQKAARQYKSPFKNMFPQMIQRADEWAHVNAEVQDGARILRYAFSVMVQAPVGEIEAAERALRSLYRTCGFDMERNDNAHLPVMLSCLPMGYGDNMHHDLHQLRLTRTGMTRMAPAIAPLQGQPRGGSVPHLILMTRMGQMMNFSPFQNEGDGNHNMCVTGSSGSGKSVFMQGVCADGLAIGYHAMVIDDGRSFETLCKILGGEHVVFRADEAVSLNPFSMISDEAMENEEEVANAISAIVQVVKTMARGEDGCSREEAGLIDEMVGMVWADRGREGTVKDVRDALRQAGGSIGQALAMSMSPYCDGTYRAFFEGECTLDLSNPFTVFEMSDLESKKDLRSVIVMCLLFQISERMRKGGRSQRKMVIVDEAWQMLGGGAAGEFINGFVRRCRKEGGALITGTQSINDYFANEGAKAAFENSQWKVVLRISAEEAEGLKESKRLSLDDASLNVLKTIKMSPREYSEMMIDGPSTRFIGRFVLDPYSATIFSSSPLVYSQIREGVQAGQSLPDVIEKVAFGGDA
jgi:conjugal transfer ATP-binding protein TraC